MHEKIIGIKELHKQLPEITKAVEKGMHFLVSKNNKPIFRIEPIERYKPYTLQDLTDLQFDGGSPGMSKKIDEISYDL